MIRPLAIDLQSSRPRSTPDLSNDPSDIPHECLRGFSCDAQFAMRSAGNTLDMTLTSIIILNAVLDVALLAGLTLAITRAAKLTPHRPGVTGNFWRLHRPHRRAARTREEHVSGQLSHAFD